MMKKAFIIWRLCSCRHLLRSKCTARARLLSACTESQLTARAEVMGRLSPDGQRFVHQLQTHR